MIGDGGNPRVDDRSMVEAAVPPPSTNEIDAIVDAVSSGGRPRIIIADGRAPEELFESEAPASHPRLPVHASAVLQPAVLRWSAVSMLAFTIGAAVTWGVVRSLEPKPAPVAVNRVPPDPIPPGSRPARPPAEAMPQPAAVSPLAPITVERHAEVAGRADRPIARPSTPVVTPRETPLERRAAARAALEQSPAPMPVRAPSPASVEVSAPNPAPLPEPASIPAVPLRVAEATVPEAPREASSPARPEAVSASHVIERAASQDEDAVRETLQDYENAYTTLDVVAAVDVWPSVDRRALARAFGTLKSQGLAFDRCDVRVNAQNATVQCFGTIQYVRKIGNTTPQVGRQEWLFKMRKLGSEWKIDNVTATQVSAPSASSRRRES